MNKDFSNINSIKTLILMKEFISSKKQISHEKVFKHRESILTDLFRISHIRTLRHIFISILIVICFQLVVFDLTNLGR